MQNRKNKGNFKTGFLIPIILGLVASCAPSQPHVPQEKPVAVEEQRIEQKLTQNSKHIETLLIELAEAEKPIKPLSKDVINHLNYEVTVKWIGPIEPVLQSITKLTGMGFKIIGTPRTPVLVNVDVKNEIVLEVLRNLGMQSGNLARIIYRPEANVVDLVYPKNFIISEIKTGKDAK